MDERDELKLVRVTIATLSFSRSFSNNCRLNTSSFVSLPSRRVPISSAVSAMDGLGRCFVCVRLIEGRGCPEVTTERAADALQMDQASCANRDKYNESSSNQAKNHYQGV